LPINTKLLLECSLISVVLLSLGTLLILRRQRAFRDYPFVAAFLAVEALAETIVVSVLYFRRYLGLDRIQAYRVYFVSAWVFFVLEYALVLLVIYGIFHLAMRPFPGLKQAGKLVFRWVFGISLVLSCVLSCYAVTGGHLGPKFWLSFHEQIHEAMGILALCLLLFVTFSLRYLGLTYRSRLFGISLGVGIWATTNLVESALLATKIAPSTVYSPFYLCGSFGYLVTIAVWAIYFVLPEPERQLVLLPTTSSFFFWNHIFERLGRATGQAVSGRAAPEMLAKGELEVLGAATRASRSRKIRGIFLVSSGRKQQQFAAKQ